MEQNWQVFATAEEVAQRCADLICQVAKQAIEDRGSFHLVTAGGTTPIRVYQYLAECTSDQCDWQNWHIYIGDERALPVKDLERNSEALNQAWLNLQQIPADNIHFMPTELGVEQAAKQYVEVVNGIELFDLTLLGMGEDGHTASLFPGHHYLDFPVVIEKKSPKPPAERVSLSFQRLSESRLVVKLITGAGKREALAKWLAGENLPIKQVVGQENLVYLDRAAMP